MHHCVVDLTADIMDDAVMDGMSSNICGNSVHSFVDGGCPNHQRIFHHLVHAIADIRLVEDERGS